MDPRPTSYNHFYSLCIKWRQKHPSEDPEFKLFLELLDISESDFEDDCHDHEFVRDMTITLRAQISWLEKSQDWIELARIWEVFKLGSDEDVHHLRALGVEAAIANDRPSVAANIVAKHKLSKDLTDLALTEYARDCETRGCSSEFQIFCRTSGILPNGPTPQFF